MTFDPTEDQKLIEQLRRMVLAPGRSFRFREDVAAVALAADRLEASLEREGWKTIDSAPTRGPVLTFIPDPRSPVGGWVNIQTWRGDADGWCGAGEAKRRRAVQPTHWRPLPTAPEGK